MPDDQIDLLDAPSSAPAGDGGNSAPADGGAKGDASKTAPADGRAPEDGGKAADTGDKQESQTSRRGRDPKPKGDAKPNAKPTEGKGAKAPPSDDDLGFEDDDENGNPKSPATWPDDWREKLAGDNEKLAKRLGRFSSPESLLKSWQNLEQKLSSGEYKRALPEDASDEEKAAWRAENDIPDKPEDYGLPEIKGHEWSEADKAIASGFLADLHAANAPKGIAHQALQWYAKFQQQQMEATADRDRADLEAREDALRTEWGPKDFRPHIKLAKDTFQDDEFISPDLRKALAGARTADGQRLIYHPDFTRFLAERGLERRGPGGLITGEQGARMGSRLDEIRKIRDTDLDRYYAEGLDKEYLELSEKVGAGSSR